MYYNENDDDDDDDDDEFVGDLKSISSSSSPSTSDSRARTTATSSSSVAPSTFFSRKSITDATEEDGQGRDFRRLCDAANISRPSKVQSLAWPHLLRGESCVIADQTGSGKTLSYLLPLLMRLRIDDAAKKKRGGGGRQRPTSRRHTRADRRVGRSDPFGMRVHEREAQDDG